MSLAMGGKTGGKAPIKPAKVNARGSYDSYLTAVLDACEGDMLDGRLLNRQRFAHHQQSGGPLREDLRPRINHQILDIGGPTTLQQNTRQEPFTAAATE